MKTVQYLSPDGSLMKVEMIDDERKQVYATKNGTNHHWFLKREYSLWKEIGTTYVPDIPAQIIEEVTEPIVSKPIKTKKKKDDKADKE